MNYIKEINAFYDSIEHEALSSSAHGLWHTLIHINNKTHWVRSFTATGTILQYKSGLSSSSFKRARTELTERGYITYESRGRNKAPVYTINSLVHETINELETPATNNTSNNLITDTNHKEDQYKDNLAQQKDPETVPLRKQDKTIPNKTNKQQPAPTDAIFFYNQNFQTASAYITASITDWAHKLPENLIIHAMERALEQGKPTWGYVKAILTTWSKKGIQTIEAAHQDRIAFQNKQKQAHQEVIPDWFHTHETNNKNQPAKPIHKTEDDATILKETQTLIDAFKTENTSSTKDSPGIPAPVS